MTKLKADRITSSPNGLTSTRGNAGGKGNRCIVCHSSDSQPLYHGIVRCQKCGHVFADTELSDQELFALYRRSYFFGDEYSDYVADKSVLQKNFELRLLVLRRFLDPNRHKTLFEIGCAYGFFLELASSYFDRVAGIDVSEDGVRYARKRLNLDVIQGDFLTTDLSGEEYDVVCIWDVIEHLREPDRYVEKLSRYMERGSLLAITTGDIESFNARFRKDRWRLLHPPTHLHYFSKSTLTKLLHEHGFDVVYNRYCGFHRSAANAAYNALALRWGQPALYNLLKRSGLTGFDFYLNLYDIMYVIARKR